MVTELNDAAVAVGCLCKTTYVWCKIAYCEILSRCAHYYNGTRICRCKPTSRLLPRILL